MYIPNTTEVLYKLILYMIKLITAKHGMIILYMLIILQQSYVQEIYV